MYMYKCECQARSRALSTSGKPRHTRKPPRKDADLKAFANTAELESPASVQPSNDMDWDNLGFNVENVAPTMFIATTDSSGAWSEGQLQPYGPLSMDPAAQVLNYGQSIFEGMKAQRTEQGQIVLFRPTDNAARMREGATRMSMIPPDEDLFVRGVLGAVRENASMVPPAGKGSLYLRPLLLGTGPILGLGTAPGFTFTVYATPVGAYFKSGQMDPIDLLVETSFHRAAPGGMGATKCAGNYSPVLNVQLEAKKQGFADVMYLDALTNTYLEEVSSCNIFIVSGNTVKTPPLSGTILPGVTRRSVVTLLGDMGYEVKEEPVSIQEAMQADEVFTTGTAVVVSSVGSITYQGKFLLASTSSAIIDMLNHAYNAQCTAWLDKVKNASTLRICERAANCTAGQKKIYCLGEVGPVTEKVYQQVIGIQTQQMDDPYGWVYPVEF